MYACGLNNLALMYKSLEDYDEAAMYYDKALQVYEDVCSVVFLMSRPAGKITNRH